MEAAGAASVARGTDLNAKKALAVKIFRSNLSLSEKIVRGDALNPWAALRAAPTSRDWVPKRGLEPP